MFLLTRDFIYEQPQILILLQLFFFEGELPEKIFLNEIEFVRLFKFDELRSFELVRRNLTQVSNLSNVCTLLQQALNRSKLSAEVNSNTACYTERIQFKEFSLMIRDDYFRVTFDDI